MTVGTGLSKQHTVIGLGDKGFAQKHQVDSRDTVPSHRNFMLSKSDNFFKTHWYRTATFYQYQLLVLFSYFLTHKVTCDFVRRVL